MLMCLRSFHFSVPPSCAGRRSIDFKTNVTIRKVVLVTLLQLKYLSSAVIYLNLLKLINANYARFQKESFHNC